MKVGDRVRVIDSSKYYEKGAEGIILNNYEGLCFVKFETGNYDKSVDNCWYANKEKLEIISYQIAPEVKINKQRFWAVVADGEILEICHTRQDARDYHAYILDNARIFKVKKASVRKVDVSILKEKV